MQRFFRLRARPGLLIRVGLQVPKELGGFGKPRVASRRLRSGLSRARLTSAGLNSRARAALGNSHWWCSVAPGRLQGSAWTHKRVSRRSSASRRALRPCRPSRSRPPPNRLATTVTGTGRRLRALPRWRTTPPPRELPHRARQLQPGAGGHLEHEAVGACPPRTTTRRAQQVGAGGAGEPPPRAHARTRAHTSAQSPAPACRSPYSNSHYVRVPARRLSPRLHPPRRDCIHLGGPPQGAPP